MIAVESKVCSKCHATKALLLFAKDPNTKSGFGSQCKECRATSCKQYRAIHKEKMSLYNRTRPKPLKPRKSRESAEVRRLRGLKSRDVAKDAYVAALLHMPVKSLSDRLLFAKREQLYTYRALKELNQTIKQQGEIYGN